MVEKILATLAVVALIVAIAVFAGAVLKDDPVGRSIIGVAWALLSLVWFGFYLRARNKRIRSKSSRVDKVQTPSGDSSQA